MKPIKLFYYRDQNNFGDVLAPLMIERLFGKKTEYSDPWLADMISIGSLVDVYSVRKIICLRKFMRAIAFYKPIAIWGSGFLYEHHYFMWRKLAPTLLRGKKTQERLGNPQLPLGDPGLIADRLLDKRIIKKYNYGVIPHYSDYHSPYIHALKEMLPESLIINVKEPVLDVIEKISQCEIVISTSLHGLIVADSFGIPNVWARTDNILLGDDYKFKDYYSVYDIDNPKFINLTKYYDLNTIKEIIDDYNRPHIEDIKNNIFTSFPDCY